MTRRGRLLVAAVIGIITIVGVGWAASLSLGGPPSVGSPPSFVLGRSPLLDQPAPAIALETLDGSQRVSLADYRGRPVIINFWASWCVPCRQEFPLFKAARDANAAAGLEILGVVHNDAVTSARQFALDQGATWPMLLDPDNSAWGAYDGALVPTTFYVDRNGVVRAISYGPPPSGTLAQELAKIL